MSNGINQDFEASRKKLADKKLAEMIARQSARQRKLKESEAQIAASQKRFEESFVLLIEMVRKIDPQVDRLKLAREDDDERARRFAEADAWLVRRVRDYEEHLDVSFDSDERLRESDERLNTKFEEMLETHRHTEERLDAFIAVLERYISEGRNGGAPKQ